MIHHQRVIPVSVRCVPLRTTWPVPLAELWPAMVDEVVAVVPPGCPVTLLADRGLVGPGIIRPCTNAGWEVVLRLKAHGSGYVRDATGETHLLADWVAQPGCWSQPVHLFKRAGWLAGWVTRWEDPAQAEPWILFSTQPGGEQRVAEYARRMTIEATFQDLKRRGFGVASSRVRDPQRIERLVLVLAWALWWVQTIGVQVERRGQRRQVDRPDRPAMSLLKLGWCWIDHWLADRRRRRPPVPRLTDHRAQPEMAAPSGRPDPGRAQSIHQHARTLHQRAVRTRTVRL